MKDFTNTDIKDIPDSPPLPKAWENVSVITPDTNLELKKQIREQHFEIMFDRVLEDISNGKNLIEIFEDDGRALGSGNFVRWVREDEDRLRRFNDAFEINADILVSTIPSIADGRNTLEDVQRSKLKIDSIKYLAGVYNRKKYTETKEVKIGGTISVMQALKEADSRLLLDAEYSEVT